MPRQLLIIIAFMVITAGMACQREAQLPDAIISGGSMYPSMPGEHYSVTCDDCKFPFIFDNYKPPASGMVVCPNCGFTEIDFRNQNQLGAIRPRLKPIASTKPIPRWEIVVFQSTFNSQQPRNVVKRVVGLPGEQISAANGNLYANGKILSKPIEIFNRTKQIVFDSKYLQRDRGANRFTPLTIGKSAWSFTSEQWRFASAENVDEFDFIRYRHIRGYRHFDDRFEPTVIEDSSAFNQNVSRKLFPVSDLQVDLNVELRNDAEFCLRLKNSKELLFLFSPEQLTLLIDQQSVASSEFISNNDQPLRISFSVYDDQIYVHLNDKILLKHEFEPGDGNMEVDVGARRGEMALHRVRIFRDIHYLSIQPSKDTDGYFVLGDNPPISVDSRQFGRITRAQIKTAVDSTNFKHSAQ